MLILLHEDKVKQKFQNK